MIRRLTYEDIVDASGVINVEELDNLEILFTTCDELGGLNKCTRLRRLAMIDNGLKKISNLEPLRMSLVTLCLCDQNISVIEGLDMPCLRELYLHRNCIKEIGDGLVGCPKLTKLWLFQNAIKKVSGLSNLSLLEECWLQANKIKKLDGFEYNQNLVYLGVAGNPIQTYGELLKLKHLNNLQELSCNDIHFGRCGIVDVIDGGGYKEFVMCHLPQIHLLDGITITKAIQHQAELLYDAQVKLFNAKLVEIDDSYRKELANIELRRQSGEHHNKTLEKEIGTSLADLEGVVRSGRKAVDNEISRQKAILDKNYLAFENNVNNTYSKSINLVQNKLLPSIVDEYDLIECLFHILENVTIAENQIMESLVEAYEYINVRTNDESSLKERESHKHGSLRIKNGKNEQRAFAFSSISENTVDFQYVANLLNASRYFKHKQSSNFDKASIVESNANSRSETKLLEDTNELGLVLMKLYRVCLNTTLNTNTAVYSPEGSLGSNLPNSLQLNSQYQRVYTVMTPSMLASLLKYGWEYSYIYASAADTSASSTQNSNVVWCTDPEIAVALFVNTPYTNGLVNNSKTNAISNQAAKPPEPPSATAAGSTEHDDEEEEYEADYEPLSPMKSSRQGYPASSPRKQSSLKPGNERTGSASYHGDRMDRNPKLLGAKFKLYDVIQSKSTLLLVLCCQIDISKAQIHNTFTTGEDIIIIPDAPRKREELITRLKDTKRPTKLEILLQNQHIQIHTQIRQQRDVSVQSEHYQTILKEQYNNLVYPNQQLLYILPSSICNVAISVEFVCLCLNPISNLLMLGDVGVSSNRVNENGGSSQFSLNYSNHGTKSMEMKLEALLLGNAHGSGGKNHANGNSDVNRDSNEPILPTVPSLLSEFEAAINYEIHKYQEHLLEDISQEQANQLRSIDYQLYCKDSDTKKLRLDIEKERKNQEYALKDLRTQLQFNSNNESLNPDKLGKNSKNKR